MGPLKSIVSAKLPFMTRLPKKRGITYTEEDKSLILRPIKLFAGPDILRQLLHLLCENHLTGYFSR